MDEFTQYNAGLESRIKYRFHFEDYSVRSRARVGSGLLGLIGAE